MTNKTDIFECDTLLLKKAVKSKIIFSFFLIFSQLEESCRNRTDF